MIHIFIEIVKFYLDAVSGVIISTCGWVKGQGHQMLIHSAKLLKLIYSLSLTKKDFITNKYMIYLKP
jgi:polynucleotide 5'-kinase involved in rRNA processing